MYRRISMLSEIPEDLHDSLSVFLEKHPDWDQDRVFSAAISLFLLQNGKRDSATSRIYLDTLFDVAA
ncbi:DUF2811 domain-containing protein [Halomicronema sp. CCY15110]|uniref:DUF2811 domain-containing protein n=1 Tax=Halomicronema sp. CCY15110 TaxID=2767773 RepID=UPI00194EA163|nr:DUF2811 domain-containing protein [Halomicronema sp. CCY15110]